MKAPTTIVLFAALSLPLAAILTSCGEKAPQVNVSTQVTALKGTDSDAKANACAELAKGGANSASAVPALIDTLKDKDPLVRHLAAYALGQIGPKAATAIPALREAMNDQDRQVVTDAVIALRSIGDTNANIAIPNTMTGPGQ